MMMTVWLSVVALVLHGESHTSEQPSTHRVVGHHHSHGRQDRRREPDTDRRPTRPPCAPPALYARAEVLGVCAESRTKAGAESLSINQKSRQFSKLIVTTALSQSLEGFRPGRPRAHLQVAEHKFGANIRVKRPQAGSRIAHGLV